MPTAAAAKNPAAVEPKKAKASRKAAAHKRKVAKPETSIKPFTHLAAVVVQSVSDTASFTPAAEEALRGVAEELANYAAANYVDTAKCAGSTAQMTNERQTNVGLAALALSCRNTRYCKNLEKVAIGYAENYVASVEAAKAAKTNNGDAAGTDDEE